MIGSPARRVACTAVRQLLYAAETGTMAMPVRLERHRQECLACQAEAVRQRRIVRALADLEHELEQAPRDLSGALVPDDATAVERSGTARAPRTARTALAGAASLAALGIAVAMRAKRAS